MIVVDSGEVKKEIPHLYMSCANGYCGTCVHKVIEGKTWHPPSSEPFIPEGCCLPCVAVALTPCLLERL